MNGEMLVVANDFLIRLTKAGFVFTDIRVKSISYLEPKTIRTIFSDYSQFYSTFSEVLSSSKPWEYVGDYPFVESMNITYPRLGYTNLFRCYDIIGNRKIVQTVGVTRNTQSTTSLTERVVSDATKIRDLERTIDNLNKEFNQYQSDSKSTYNKIINYYVDRNYMNDGYVNTDPNTP